MVVVQRLFADGYELTFIAGGAAAFGKPADGRGPEHILLTFKSPVNVRVRAIGIILWDTLLEISYSADMLKIMLRTVFSKLGRAYQMVEYLPVCIYRVQHEVVYRALA